MLILALDYLKPTEEADRVMAAHLDWVRQGYDRGLFLASGRKVPRTGGVILACGERTAIEAFAATDPFIAEGIAAYQITEVALTRTIPGLEALQS
jgi:uncharacterized protein YciI